jgi:hypothetical protein
MWLLYKDNTLLRAEVAQSVEQGTENPRVGSSILSLGTNKFKGLQRNSVALFYFGQQFGQQMRDDCEIVT